MFEAKLNDASIFRKIIEALREIVKEGNFEVTEQGITFQGVDSSFVALVQLTLLKRGFATYRVDDSLNLGIQIENILKLLKCGGAKDSLTLSAKDDSDVLSLYFEGQDRRSKFDQKLMDIDNESLTVPTIQYDTVCHMSSSEFQRIIRDMSTIGDTVEITISQEGITFAVEGPTGSGSTTLDAGNGDDKEGTVKIKAEEEFKQKFTLRYLNSFAKAATLSDQVALKLSLEQPLAVEYRMSTINENDEKVVLGALRFFLAPKSSDENNDE